MLHPQVHWRLMHQLPEWIILPTSQKFTKLRTVYPTFEETWPMQKQKSASFLSKFPHPHLITLDFTCLMGMNYYCSKTKLFFRILSFQDPFKPTLPVKAMEASKQKGQVADYRTFTNSTSNTSHEFGGIFPPAPLSP